MSVTSVLRRATDRQSFFALYALAVLACELAPSREALKELHDLAARTMPWDS